VAQSISKKAVQSLQEDVLGRYQPASEIWTPDTATRFEYSFQSDPYACSAAIGGYSLRWISDVSSLRAGDLRPSGDIQASLNGQRVLNLRFQDPVPGRARGRPKSELFESADGFPRLPLCGWLTVVFPGIKWVSPNTARRGSTVLRLRRIPSRPLN